MSIKTLDQIAPPTQRALAQIRDALLDWRPPALLGVYALLVLLLTQLPFSYSFRPGIERGQGSDAPFLYNFYPHEGVWPDGMFRWSRGAYPFIEIPGIGRRPVILELAIVSHRAQWEADAPPTLLTLHPLEAPATAPQFTLRREGARYQVLFGPDALPDGTLHLRVETPTWQNAGDRREEIGIAIGERVAVLPVREGGVTLPDFQLLWGYPLALLILWLTVRLIGFSPRGAFGMLLPLAIGIPLLLLLDAPRLGFGAPWAISAARDGLLAAVVTLALVPPLLRKGDVALPERLLPWLALLIVAAFMLKFSARFYPEAMPGDIQLHMNRYNAMARGQQYIDAQHRGLPFPFPTGLYLIVAPLTLTGVSARTIFPLLAGIFESSSVLLFYALLTKALGRPRLGVVAAAIYTLTAGGHMTTWFAFFSHVSTQWYTLALALALTVAWPRYQRPAVWWIITFLIIQVSLGHIGTFINLVVFGLALVPILWLYARDREEKRAVLALAGAALAGGAFVGMTFYSVYLDQFIGQFVGIATQGMSDLTGKRPIPPEVSLRVIWEGGLINHFGFFPAMLGLLGVGLFLRRRAERTALPWLILATAISSMSQAILPFITLSSITTRWLMFSAWAIAVTAAPVVALLWRRGRGGRVVVAGMAGYVAWITLLVWLEAMTLRKPPIEPF